MSFEDELIKLVDEGYDIDFYNDEDRSLHMVIKKGNIGIKSTFRKNDRCNQSYFLYTMLTAAVEKLDRHIEELNSNSTSYFVPDELEDFD